MGLEKKLECSQSTPAKEQKAGYFTIEMYKGADYEKPEVIIPLYSGEIPTAGCCLRSCGGKS